MPREPFSVWDTYLKKNYFFSYMEIDNDTANVAETGADS